MFKFWMILLSLFLVILSACTTVSSQEAAAPVSVMEVTQSPSTAVSHPFAGSDPNSRPEPGSGVLAGTGEHGISFQYDLYLATSLVTEMVVGTPSVGVDDFGFDVMPDHIAFTFANTYADAWEIYHQPVNIPSQPQILIFPLAAYAGMNEMANAQITQLQEILRNRPDLPNGALPHLPPPNGQQDLQAQFAYLSFENGTGIRYLTQFNQEMRQINNQEIYYTFQGITTDGAYYIAAFFPVQSDSLPADNTVADYDAFANNLPNYLTETTAVLNQQTTDTFTPNLALLDAVVQTLNVAPTVTLTSPESTQTDDLFCSQISRPALLLAAGNGYHISNPLTGEQCLIALPPNMHQFTQIAADVAYGFAIGDNGTLRLEQLHTDGSISEVGVLSEENSNPLTDFILTPDGEQIIWSTATVVDGDQYHNNLWIADIDGQNHSQLVDDLVAPYRKLIPLRMDGDTVYFYLQIDGIGGMWNGFYGRYDALYSVALGEEPQKIMACEDLALSICIGDLSADNQLVVYTDYVNNTLHIVQLDGTAVATMPLVGDYSGHPIFLPNGDLVMYTAVLQEDEDGISVPHPGTLQLWPTPYTDSLTEIINGDGIMFPVATYDEQHVIINYIDEEQQWGNALLNLPTGSVAPLQPWPGAYFVTIVND